MVDNREVVKVGDLEKKMASRPMVKPKFATAFLEAVVRGGRCEGKKKVCCAPSLTPRMWVTTDGSLRSWMRTGMSDQGTASM